MAERKQSSFDGQNSDGGGKDELVSQSPKQVDSYHARGADFPVKKVSAAHGQSEDQMGGGLVPWPGNLSSPREVEVSGGEKDSMTERASRVAANFKVSKNSGESGSAPTSPGNEYSVNLSTGHVECSGYKQTRVKEVPEDEVTIG